MSQTPGSTPTHDPGAVATVRDLVKDERTCMLTTVGPDGSLVSRPMATQEVEFDGDLNALEAAGLVTRTAHPSDGRQVLLAASPEGAGIVREDRRRRDAWLAQRLRDLPREDVEVLRRAAVVLERLAAS